VSCGQVAVPLIGVDKLLIEPFDPLLGSPLLRAHLVRKERMPVAFPPQGATCRRQPAGRHTPRPEPMANLVTHGSEQVVLSASGAGLLPQLPKVLVAVVLLQFSIGQLPLLFFGERVTFDARRIVGRLLGWTHKGADRSTTPDLNANQKCMAALSAPISACRLHARRRQSSRLRSNLFGKLRRGHPDVAQDAAQRADFERTIGVDGHGRAQVAALEEVVTAAHTKHLKSPLLQKTEHFLPGDAGQLSHGQARPDSNSTHGPWAS
jgi:hypothetical protein